MSRHKPVKIKRSAKLNRQIKNSNELVFKLIDPIAQFLIFVYFLYALDSEQVGVSYRGILLKLVGWQVISAVINFFFTDPKILKTQRVAYIVVNTLYMAFFFYAESHFKETYFGINETDPAIIPLNQSLLIAGAIIIAFWYNIICYREVRSMLAGANKDI